MNTRPTLLSREVLVGLFVCRIFAAVHNRHEQIQKGVEQYVDEETEEDFEGVNRPHEGELLFAESITDVDDVEYYKEHLHYTDVEH